MAAEDESDRQDEDGFEYRGVFYRWHLGDTGKDLMLIDAFAKMPPTDFFALIEDEFDRGRVPVLLTMIATSIRHKHPEWTVERITRTVMDMSLGDVAFIDGDREEDPRPPAGAANGKAATETSISPVAESSPSSTPEATWPTSETLSGIP